MPFPFWSPSPPPEARGFPPGHLTWLAAILLAGLEALASNEGLQGPQVSGDIQEEVRDVGFTETEAAGKGLGSRGREVGGVTHHMSPPFSEPALAGAWGSR